jgi:cysteinyl-tRNA synthetase
MDKGKMSKSSEGGGLTLQSLVDSGYDPLDYRYFLLSGHDRSQLQFSFEALDGARNARRSLLERVRALADKTGIIPVLEEQTAGEEAGGYGKADAYLEAFDAALDEDLSTPKALAGLWTLLRDGEIPPKAVLTGALVMDRVLGLGLATEVEGVWNRGEDLDFNREIEGLIGERWEAKKNKDFVKADEIRNALKKRGILLEDGPAGTLWRRG